jgi:hypothetical protein
MQSTNVTEHLNDISYSEFRRSTFNDRDSDVRISNWTAMTAGQKYYIMVEVKNYNGGNYLNLGVEIEQATLNAAHPRNVKEVQRLSYSQPDTRETHHLDITNFANDTGSFVIRFTNQELKTTNSGTLKTTMSANNIRDGIKSYMNSVGVNTVVRKLTYDANGAETATEADIVKIRFEIKIDRMVSTATTTNMLISGSTSSATITITRNVVTSGTPLSG